MSRLQPENKAIPFNVIDYRGTPVMLSDYKGKKVLLSFFRGASCPFCNMRLHELIKRHEEFEASRIHIIAVFASTREEILQYSGKQLPPFPILPDPELTLYRHYGVEASQAGMFKVMLQPIKMLKMMTSGFFSTKALTDKPLIPADFLIGENFLIKRVYYGNDFGDHMPIKDILAWGSDQ